MLGFGIPVGAETLLVLLDAFWVSSAHLMCEELLLVAGAAGAAANASMGGLPLLPSVGTPVAGCLVVAETASTLPVAIKRLYGMPEACFGLCVGTRLRVGSPAY